MEGCTVLGHSPLSSTTGSTAQEVHIGLPLIEPLPQARVQPRTWPCRSLALRPKCKV